jgi:uncharacterized protein (DUF1501 family)
MTPSTTLKTRREFLRTTVLGGALSWTLPSFLAETFSALDAAAADAATAPLTGRDAPILVVLQLAGGNDGLNTVVPFANDHYHRARPRLGLHADKVLKLDGQFGLHPSLTGFKRLFDEGLLAVVHGVGYPNPNRSHFRSTEIWQTASDADRFERHGWLGRFFDHACAGADPTVGISIGRQMPQAFASPRPIGVSLESPERYRALDADGPRPGQRGRADDFYRQLNEPVTAEMVEAAAADQAGGSIGALAGQVSTNLPPLDFVERVALDAQVSSERVRAVSQRVQNQATYPQGQLAAGLRLVARLIGGGMPTRVYYVSQGGYDTHANQVGAHTRLLEELGGSVQAFLSDLKAQGNLERVLLLTFSEFGRRVAENANAGTDHGAAAPMFLAGAKVKAGTHGQFPSLAPPDLLNGDLRFTTDFRSVYAGVLEDWLRTPSEPILHRRFEPIHCLSGV